MKNKTLQYATYKRLTSGLRTYRLKISRWKKIFHGIENDKKLVAAVFILDKGDLKSIKKGRKDII